MAPQTGWLVYRRSEEPLDGEITLGTDVGVTGEASAFDALIRGAGPADFRLVLGCAGWAPGQLEAEISEGAWLPVDLEADLVFETEPEELWDQAYRRTIGTSPAAFSSRPAKA